MAHDYTTRGKPEYRYSGPKTKAHPKGTIRRLRPYLQQTSHGWQWTRIREEWERGKWEGYANYSRLYPTKAAAMKHIPKW